MDRHMRQSNHKSNKYDEFIILIQICRLDGMVLSSILTKCILGLIPTRDGHLLLSVSYYVLFLASLRQVLRVLIFLRGM